MNNLRYCCNGNSNINNNKINYYSAHNQYIKTEQPKDMYSTRGLYPTELKLQDPDDSYSTFFYPTYVTTTYPETRSYRPGGCCTQEIYYRANVSKRTLAYRPYIKRCSKSLIYSPTK
jgi:hypothetical protein